jgi:hypothetical protein
LDSIENLTIEVGKISKDIKEIKEGKIKVEVMLVGKKPQSLDLSFVLQTLIDRPMDVLNKAGKISDNLMKVFTLLQFLLTIIITLFLLFGGK